jgi:hypothetical protein
MMRETREPESMGGSLNSTMGEPLMASNKRAYFGHRELPIDPDVITSGKPGCGLLLSDPPLCGHREFSEFNGSLRLSAWVCG